MVTQKEVELIQSIALVVAADAEGVQDSPERYCTSWCTRTNCSGCRTRSVPKLVNEIQTKFGIKSSSGMYRTAFILDNVVVKVSKNPRRQKELESEAKYIQKMKKTQFARHFPQTEIFKIGGVCIQVQEKVDMSHRRISYDMQDAATDLADRLGLEDMHSGNYGWKDGKNGKYPVFVDVDFRNSERVPKKRKKRSWML